MFEAPRKVWIPDDATQDVHVLAFVLDLTPSQELVLCPEQSWPGFRAYDVRERAGA